MRGNGEIRADFSPLELTPPRLAVQSAPDVSSAPPLEGMACFTLLQIGGPSGVGLRGSPVRVALGPRGWVGSQSRYSWVSMLWSWQSTGSVSPRVRSGPPAGKCDSVLSGMSVGLGAYPDSGGVWLWLGGKEHTAMVRDCALTQTPQPGQRDPRLLLLGAPCLGSAAQLADLSGAEPPLRPLLQACLALRFPGPRDCVTHRRLED